VTIFSVERELAFLPALLTTMWPFAHTYAHFAARGILGKQPLLRTAGALSASRP